MCQEFAHLHCHSEYSLLDGLSRVNDLVQRAQELNQPALALTDHGAMYGVMAFYRAAKTAGIKPIIGIETYVAARKMGDRDAQLDKERFHLLLLAQNQTGYANLLELATMAQLEGYYYKPRVDHDVLAQFGEGLISSTGCLAAKIPQALMHGRTEQAHQLMGEYIDIFGKERFFIELQEHSLPELTAVNKSLIEMAPRYGLQNNFLVTNDVHYTRAEDAGPHQVLLCIQTGSTTQSPKLTFSDKGYYLKSYEEMFELFQKMGYDETVIRNGLANSLLITDMCEVSLDSEGYHLPIFEVPEGQTPNSYMRELCEKGLIWRYGPERAQNDPVLRQRLEHEISIIGRMGFETYFLIVWDLCEWAVRSDQWWEANEDPFPHSDYGEWKRNDIWWNVRGSGAGSVVAYTLGITSIDPLANGLIFERFLNPGRVSMPDIDLDYPDDVRHWMVAYAKRRYGNDKVAQIITYGTMGARAAVRDVGRALDMPLPEVDRVARLIPAVPGKPVKIENCFDPNHEFYSRELEELAKSDSTVKTLLETAQSLEGITRHASSHAAGVIVSDAPLHKYVPLNRPTSGEEGLGGLDRVTQWPMEIVESIGLLKVDFLGLSTLTVMRRAARLIEKRYGVVYTMDNIPYDEGHVGPDPAKDPKVLFDALGRGEVAGVFQVEGCLSGDTMIGHRTLKELYEIFVAREQNEQTPWANKLKTTSCYVDEGAFRQNEIRKVIYSGVKPVYRLVDARGYWIKATADHYFLTQRGWVRLGDLDPAVDQILVQTNASRVRRLCPRCGAPLKTNSRKATHCEKCSAVLSANPSKPEVQAKISHSKMGQIPWNKGLTAATAAHTVWIQKLQAYGVSQRGRSMEERFGAEKAARVKKMLSERNRGKGNPMYGRPPKETKTYTKAGYRADLGHYVRSSWEADLARVFVYQGFAYQYEPQTFELVTETGHPITYTPDFYVPETDTWFEVKGWMDEASGRKIALFQAQYPDQNLVVVDKTAFAEFQLQYQDLVAWECPQFPPNSHLVGIEQIAYVGEEATYDIQMRPPGNNFIASGFVVHNSGMKKLMMEMKPRRFDHIVAAISLYRPGPMDNIPEYIRRMHSDIYAGKDIVEYHTPALKPILGDTYGILVYQEQIIRIASDLAGYEPGEADMIRKAVSKKKRSLIDEHRVKFTDGAMKNGYTKQVCDAIWDDIEFFARYGFNKCLPGDVEVLDAATGRLVRVEDLYHGRATLQQTITCDMAELKLKTGAVTAVLNNGVKPVYRLTTALGKQIEATANHPFYTFEGWRLLGELEVGQHIGVPRTLPRMGQTKWPAHEVIVLAHLLAEGNLCHPHSVYYYTQRDTSLQDYVQAAEQFSNVTCTVAVHKGTYSVYAKRTDKAHEPGLVPWAKALGIWGKNARTKEIPAEVFTLGPDQLALLLGRLWDGDGSFVRQTQGASHAYYATSSERLARQVQHLLLRLGVMSSLRTQLFPYKEGRVGYQVHIMGGEHLVRFAAVVGAHFLHPDWLVQCAELTAVSRPNLVSKDVIPVGIKQLVRHEKEAAQLTWDELHHATGAAVREFSPTASEGKRGFRRQTIHQLATYFDSPDLRRHAESDLYWDTIVAIEYVGEKQTYDLTIDETHNFVANDILVHNSHAADYAKVTCQTAFLKAHYPVEYLTAMLSVERDNSEKVRFYFTEAKSLGIEVRPPHLNHSDLDFTIQDEDGRSSIRFGLAAIRNVGESALSSLMAERESGGPFASLQDLADRVDLRRVGKRPLEFMIKARVFDEWGPPPQLWEALDRLVGESGRSHDAAAAGQMSLFGGLGAAVQLKGNLLKPVSELKGEYAVEHKAILEWEKEALGVYVSEHPMERQLEPVYDRGHWRTTSQLEVTMGGRDGRMAGMITHLRHLTTKKGDSMAFGTLEDMDGRLDLVFFPRTWAAVRQLVQMDAVLVVYGKFKANEDETLSLMVDKVETVEEYLKRQSSFGHAVQEESAYAYETPPTLDWVTADDDDDEPVAPTYARAEAPRRAPAVLGTSNNGRAATISVAAPPPPVASASNGRDMPPPPPNFEEGEAGEPAPPIVREPLSLPPAPDEAPKLIVVEMDTSQQWQPACRQVVQLAGRFHGRDQFVVQFPHQRLEMTFAHQTTHHCPELTQQLANLPGVVRVHTADL